MNQSRKISDALREGRVARIGRNTTTNLWAVRLDNDDFTPDDIQSAVQAGFRKGAFDNDLERGAVVAGSEDTLIQWLKSRGIRAL